VAAVLHIPTLTLCLAATLVIVAAFLTLLWALDRTDKALAWWSLGFWLASFGLCLVSLRDVAPPLLALGLGNAASISSLGLVWLGCLAFEDENRKAALPIAFAGGFVWLALFAFPAFSESLAIRLFVASAFYSSYSFLVVHMLWRGQCREPLPARVLAILAFALHGSAYILRIPLQFIDPVHLVNGMGPTWYGLMTFGFLLQGLTGGLAIFAMVHERTSQRYKRASEVDFLTSLNNRRAFLLEIETVRARPAGDAAGAVLALVDADHFKAINDTHGHAAGDAALVGLARVLSGGLPEGAIVGRVGGEEFGIYLPADVAGADGRVLDRFRREVAEKTISHDLGALRMTVSVGAVCLPRGPVDLSAAFAAADRALYDSKQAGRDCVRFVSLDEASGGQAEGPGPLPSHVALA